MALSNQVSPMNVIASYFQISIGLTATTIVPRYIQIIEKAVVRAGSSLSMSLALRLALSLPCLLLCMDVALRLQWWKLWALEWPTVMMIIDNPNANNLILPFRGLFVLVFLFFELKAAWVLAPQMMVLVGASLPENFTASRANDMWLDAGIGFSLLVWLGWGVFGHVFATDGVRKISEYLCGGPEGLLIQNTMDNPRKVHEECSKHTGIEMYLSEGMTVAEKFLEDYPQYDHSIEEDRARWNEALSNTAFTRSNVFLTKDNARRQPLTEPLLEGARSNRDEE